MRKNLYTAVQRGYFSYAAPYAALFHNSLPGNFSGDIACMWEILGQEREKPAPVTGWRKRFSTGLWCFLALAAAAGL